jgi:hypothetical protein
MNERISTLKNQDGSREAFTCLSTMAKKSSSKNLNPQRKRDKVVILSRVLLILPHSPSV